MGRDWGYEGGFNVVVVCYGGGGVVGGQYPGWHGKHS